MKRLLSLLICMLFLSIPVLAESPDLAATGFPGVWIENDGYGTLTLLADGTAHMEYFDGTVTDTTWGLTEDGYRFGEGMWFNSPLELLDENTLSVSDGWAVFTREGFLPTTDEALLLGAEPVGDEGEPFLGTWELTSLVIEEEVLDPAAFGLTMTITLYDNGLVTTDDGMEPYTTTWSVSYGSAVMEGDILTIDENDQLVYNSLDGAMLFTRVPEEETDPANAVPVGEEGASFLGLWTLESMLIEGDPFDPSLFGMTMTLNFSEDGTVIADDGMEPETTVWYVEDGAAIVEGRPLVINEEGKLVMTDEEGAAMIFMQGEAEPAGEPSEADQLLALLELLGMMEGMDDLSELPENHQGFVGEWQLCYIMTGGLTGDLRPLGITGTLTLNADYSGELTGLADEYGTWYEDEDGTIRFGESGTPLFLIDAEEDGMGIFLQYGTEDSGCMIYHQDAEAVWTPGLYPLQTPITAAETTAPVASGELSTVGTRFVCTTYTTAGFTMDAATLGAEYAVVFHDSGTADFTMAGILLPNLPYTVTADGVYAINYYGTMFNCIPTEAGLDMDYYGTMTMHFVPAE